MTGGPTSFGAGGWIGSMLEEAMPIRCEPPQTRNLPRGALALIMHSCEMPEGNYWGQEVASAAVEALSEQDFIGIVEYSWNSGAGTNCAWTLPMQLAGDKVAAMDAVHSLTLGDMQDFDSALELSLAGLTAVDAAQRHVIIISDGDPQPPTQELVQSFRDESVTISTVMVGGHGSAMDMQMMQGIATATGGRFYMVNDPTQLPQIFIKEAQLNSRSLIQEGGPWDPTHMPSGIGPLQGIESVPPVIINPPPMSCTNERRCCSWASSIDQRGISAKITASYAAKPMLSRGIPSGEVTTTAMPDSTSTSRRCVVESSF